MVLQDLRGTFGVYEFQLDAYQVPQKLHYKIFPHVKCAALRTVFCVNQ